MDAKGIGNKASPAWPLDLHHFCCAVPFLDLDSGETAGAHRSVAPVGRFDEFVRPGFGIDIGQIHEKLQKPPVVRVAMECLHRYRLPGHRK